MTAVGPTQVVGPLKPVFDIQIRIAATPAAEFRGAGHGSRINERDSSGSPAAVTGASQGCVPPRKLRPSPVLPNELPLWRMKPNRNSFTRDGVKMWISENTACWLLSIESEPPPMKPG